MAMGVSDARAAAHALLVSAGDLDGAIIWLIEVGHLGSDSQEAPDGAAEESGGDGSLVQRVQDLMDMGVSDRKVAIQALKESNGAMDDAVTWLAARGYLTS
jgi:translation elongation factor EF-Ts